MASSELPAEDGHRIRVYRWYPDPATSPRAIMHIFHGLGEHAARYERFACACNENGLVVVAHNHRGHADTAEVAGHFADREGWDKVIADALAVQEQLVAEFPDIPVVLFGHSMGSFIAQSFVMRHPSKVSLLILSGSAFASRVEARLARAVASLLALFGRRSKSRLLDRLGFGAFNKAFAPARTDFDWLSRDDAEVDRYLADPHCGGKFSNQLWKDLMGGLLEITSADAIASIPADLPILILGGQVDPVGGVKGLTRLADVYRQTGHADVTLTIYDGGRHEMLNETNRDEVTSDVVRWIDSHLSHRG